MRYQAKNVQLRLPLEGMPKAKPVSLWPLSFEEAITAIIRADPQRVETVKTPRKKTKQPLKR
jgi:hypothetical protein